MIATSEAVVIMTHAELSAMINAAAEAAVEKARAMLPRQNVARPESVTQAEAARILGKSKPTIGRLVKAGVFRLNALGNIPMTQIDSAIAEARR